MKTRPLLLLIAYLGFISLGLPDPLIGVAWPSVRHEFGLPQGAVAAVFVGSSCGYFLSSFFTGRLLGFLGIGLLVALSSAMVAFGVLGYALAPVWMLFVAGSIMHGLGSGAIDAGLNHYVARHFSARHMTWLHACYSVGATLGPLLMTVMMVTRDSWRLGYLVVAGMLLVLSGLFAATRRNWDEPGRGDEAEEERSRGGMREALRHPLVWLHVAVFFVYTGLEIMIGQWSFSLLFEARRMPAEKAGAWVTIYWGSILAGRFLLGFVVDRWGVIRLVRCGMLAAVLGSAIFASHPSDSLSAIALALTGLGLAPVFPCLMTLTPRRLGRRLAAHAIGFQVSAAMLGAAALPSMAGLLAQRFGLEIVAGAAVGFALLLFMLHEWVLRCARKDEDNPKSGEIPGRRPA